MSESAQAAADAVDKQAYDILRGRTCPEEAITAGNLSDRLAINDGEASPKTRELIRDLVVDEDKDGEDIEVEVETVTDGGQKS
jgi:hypothetical protein